MFFFISQFNSLNIRVLWFIYLQFEKNLRGFFGTRIHFLINMQYKFENTNLFI